MNLEAYPTYALMDETTESVQAVHTTFTQFAPVRTIWTVAHQALLPMGWSGLPFPL